MTDNLRISTNPRRKPVHDGIDEEMIRALVHGFYGKVAADAVLGPIFASVIDGDWAPHLAKMVDFWSSVMLMSGRNRGNPMAAHMRLPMVRPEHFAHWLTLFRQTARDVCPPDIATVFCERAEAIARSLEFGMFYRPGAPSS